MDDEIKIEIEQIMSLANGNPESILPGLFTSSSSKRERTPEENDSEDPNQSSESQPSIPDPFLPLKKKLKQNNYVHNSKIKYHGMQATTLRFLLLQDIIGFLQEHNLIASTVECYCGKQMKLQACKRGDRIQWACSHTQKNERMKMTIRKGTFFYNSSKSFEDILMLAYMWVHEYSLISMMHEARVAPDTLTHWVKCFQDVCQAALECKNEPLGGEEKSVEIYDCQLKEGDDDKWAFCGLEQYSTNSILILVNDKSSKTIGEIFDKYFLPGTVIVSHAWCAMKNLSAVDFEYLTQDKSLTFYDQETKAEMNDYESFKKAARRPPKGLNKWNKQVRFYGPLFFERMYRKSLGYAPDAFLAFLKDVSLVYPPCTKYVKNGKSED